MGTSSLVTILFTDLVDSTALAQKIGDAAADELRRAHFEGLRSAVARTGGVEVKTIGDAMMVAYPSVSDAVAGAVVMQQSVDRANRDAGGHAISMRVGLSAGDATSEDGDWFGTPVVEAARLCSTATGGQILVADIVRVLGGTRIGVELRGIGEVELKGLPHPVRACEVLWEPERSPESVAFHVDLPAHIEQHDVFRFVGRDAQLESLVHAWKLAETGVPQTVFVAGEPGIGKTRIVKELARVAHREGGVVLWGGCEDELGLPYEPWIDALRPALTATEPAELRLLLGADAGDLARLLPELAWVVPEMSPTVSSDPEVERRRLFDAVAALFERLSSRAPVLLVLDDLHWAGKPTLLLLRHVLRATAKTSLMFVGTYRDTDLDRTHPLAEMLADLRRQGGAERVPLRGLDAAGVVAFLESTAGHELEPEGQVLAAAIHLETEGNPFFIGEVLLHLAESGALVYSEGRWQRGASVAEIGIPEGVREVIGRRLSRLPAAANEILGGAAVIGREFDVQTVLALSPGDSAKVLDALEAAERSGLVQGVPAVKGGYRFAHALVRSTLYDELPTSRRLRLHQAVAHVLYERPGARAAELARHFTEAAALGEVERALLFCRRAGDEARADLAFEEAAKHYETALGVLDLATVDEQGQRGELLILLGDVLQAVADPRAREVHLAAVALGHQRGDVTLRADALIALQAGRGLRNAAPEQDILDHLRQVLIDLPDSDKLRRANLLIALLTEANLSHTFEARCEMYEEALSLAREAGDRRVLAALLRLNFMTTDMKDPRTIGRQRQNNRALIEAVEGFDDVFLFDALTELVWLSMCEGSAEESDAALERAGELAGRLRIATLEYRALCLRAARSLLSGRLDETEQLVATILRWGEIHDVNTAAAVGSLNYRLYAERGRLAELEPFLAAMVEALPFIPAWRLALAATYLQMERFDDARVQVRALGFNDFAMAPNDATFPLMMSSLTRLATIAGELEIAAAAYEKARHYSGTFVWTATTYESPVDLGCAMACAAFGKFDDAFDHLDRADALCRKVGARSYIAAANVTRAEVLLQRDRPQDVASARSLAETALADAEELGLIPVALRAHRVLGRVT